MYFYNKDPNHGLKLHHLVNHAILIFVMDIVLNSSE